MVSPGILACGRRSSPELDVLITSAARGEPSAWAAVFDHLVGAVYGYVSAHVPQQAVAEQLTEQVFVEGWSHLRAGTWSSRGVLRRLYGQAEAAIAGHHLRRPDCLAQAFATLSSDQRQILLLRFGQRLEVAAIAELLGMDADNVQRLQVRALKALRRAKLKRFSWEV